MNEKRTNRGRVAALLLAVLTLLSVLPLTASAVDATPEMLALGDSISTGYGLTTPMQDGYVYIVANKHGYKLTNRAVNGYTAEDIYLQIKGGALDAQIADAEVITVTCGGNDMMELLYHAVAEAYNAANDPDIEDWEILEAFAGDHPTLSITTLLPYATTVLSGFADTDAYKAGIVKYTADLTVVMQYLRAKNPNATVILNTQYNPYNDFVDHFFYGLLYAEVEKGIVKLNEVITSNAEALGYAIADTYTAFLGKANLCIANAENPMSPNLDFHPNKAGHALIAETVSAVIENTVYGTLSGAVGTVRFVKDSAKKSYTFSFSAGDVALSDVSWTLDGELPSGLTHVGNGTTLTISGTPTVLTESACRVSLSVRAKGSDGKTYKGSLDVSLAVVDALAEDKFAAEVAKLGCEISQESANTEESVYQWLRESWLPALLSEMTELDAWSAELLASVGYTGEVPMPEIILLEDCERFMPAAAGTAEDPDGTDGFFSSFAIVLPIAAVDGSEATNVILYPFGRVTVKATPYHAHSYSDATCIHPAACTVCGEETGDVNPSAHGEGRLELRGAVAPTEEKDGYTGDRYCMDCGAMAEKGEAIPRLGTENGTDGGCGAVVGTSAVLLAVALLLPASFALRRRED